VPPGRASPLRPRRRSGIARWLLPLLPEPELLASSSSSSAAVGSKGAGAMRPRRASSSKAERRTHASMGEGEKRAGRSISRASARVLKARLCFCCRGGCVGGGSRSRRCRMERATASLALRLWWSEPGGPPTRVTGQLACYATSLRSRSAVPRQRQARRAASDRSGPRLHPAGRCSQRAGRQAGTAVDSSSFLPSFPVGPLRIGRSRLCSASSLSPARRSASVAQVRRRALITPSPMVWRPDVPTPLRGVCKPRADPLSHAPGFPSSSHSQPSSPYLSI